MNNEKIEIIARICHEANRAYSLLLGEHLPYWDQLEKWQRDAVKDGVKFYLDSGKTPEQAHESWLKEKIDNGWVYAEETNLELKTHPSITPYEQLPENEKIHHKLFIAIVGVFE